MLKQILILLVGFLALVKGADFFVDGSAGLARKFRIPSLVIGLTIVALGTSAPELAVSLSAALEGSNEIAFSNVMGSNVFNLLVVLGCCALIHPVPVETVTIRRDCALSLAAAVFLLTGIGFQGKLSGLFSGSGMYQEVGTVTRPMGLLLLLAFIVYMGFLVSAALRNPEEEHQETVRPIWQYLLLIGAGLLMIVVGGRMVVDSARAIALACGMSETLVGLTIVAIGTSLPELVTSLVAARKKETGLAVGNVVGSNIFNLMFILGISTSIHPITVNAASIWDLRILIVITLVTMYFALSERTISRLEGMGLLALYVADIAFAIMR